MKLETRNQIVTLCKQAGINPARVNEIESGCDEDRVVDIINAEINSGRPGTLVLSDVDAAERAYKIAMYASLQRLSDDITAPQPFTPEFVQQLSRSVPMPQNELGKPRMHIDYEGYEDSERQELSH